MVTTNNLNMRTIQIAVLIAIGIVGLGDPIYNAFHLWNNGLVEVDVITLFSLIPYAIWPISICAGMKDGFTSKKALILNIVIVLLLIAFTVLSLMRKYHPQTMDFGN